MLNQLATDAFARSFAQRTHQLAWLLGAGASASAGVPTGSDMIADFKTRLYCADFHLPRHEVDVADPIWQRRIASHFDGTRGFPPAGDPCEYAAAFEAAYPDARDRRSYIETAARRARPSFAHRVLAVLISSGFARCLFTTNFDPLIEKAAAVADDLLPPDRQAHLTVSALDSAERAQRCVRDAAWPLLVKLHGDYQSDHIKNTDHELRLQDERLRQVFIQALTQFGLLVVGYSGRDNSIMDALDQAVTLPGALPAGLCWVSRPETPLLPRVTSLLERAATSDIEVNVVHSENFDELAGDIEREVELSAPLRQHVRTVRPRPIVQPVTLPTSYAATLPAVRCSALELLSVPENAREVTLDTPLTTPEARELLKRAGVWATVASYGRRLAVLGPDDAINRVFLPLGAKLTGTVRLDPANRSTDLGLVYEALVKSIARNRPLRPVLRRAGHAVTVRPPSDRVGGDIARQHQSALSELQQAYKSPLTGTVSDLGCPYAEAIRVRVEVWDGRWWLVYEPYTWVDLPRNDQGHQSSEDAHRYSVVTIDDSTPQSIAASWRRERWARRYNRTWHHIVAAWATLIAPESEVELSTHYFAGSGVNAKFRLSSTTAWSSPIAVRFGEGR